MCKKCEFTNVYNHIKNTRENKILFDRTPILIDTNILIDCITPRKNFVTEKTINSFFEFMKKGREYVLVYGGNKLHQELSYDSVQNNRQWGNILTRITSGYSSAKIYILGKNDAHANLVFESELKILEKMHWSSNKKKNDPYIMLTIKWFTVKYLLTRDKGCSKKIKKSFEEYMGEKLSCEIFDESKIVGKNFDFVNSLINR